MYHTLLRRFGHIHRIQALVQVGVPAAHAGDLTRPRHSTQQHHQQQLEGRRGPAPNPPHNVPPALYHGDRHREGGVLVKTRIYGAVYRYKI